MNAGPIGFLLLAGSVGLFLWRPQVPVAKALRMLVWGLLTLVVSVLFLAALFSFWWPPAQVWAAVWLGAALCVLALMAVANSGASGGPL